MRVLVDIDPDKFAEAGIEYTQAGASAFFKTPDGTIPAVIEEGKIALFPKRALAHRRLMAILGQSVPE